MTQVATTLGQFELLKAEYHRAENEHGDVVYFDDQGRSFTEEELVDVYEQEQYERYACEDFEK